MLQVQLSLLRTFIIDSVSFRSAQEAESNPKLLKAELQAIHYLVILRKMINSVSHMSFSEILSTFDRRDIGV